MCVPTQKFVKNPNFEYQNPCLRRSGFAQEGETNLDFQNSNFLKLHLFRTFQFWVFYIVSKFEFRASNLNVLSCLPI